MTPNLYTEYRAARSMGYSAKDALSYTREALKTADLGLPRYPADTVIEKGGVMFTVKIENDSDSTPWDWDCFYGVPSRTYRRYTRDDKPGIKQISDNSGNTWDYPRAEAIAKCADMHRLTWPHCTRYQQAIKAVDAEINYWHDWLNDSRYFIGVIVTAESPEGFTADQSLWGVEAGDYHGYWRSCAADLIAECAGE